MTSPLDETTKLLAGLALGGSCMKTLESLRILLASVSLSELKEYAPKIDIDRIYKCLATSNKYYNYLLPMTSSTHFECVNFFFF